MTRFIRCATCGTHRAPICYEGTKDTWRVCVFCRLTLVEKRNVELAKRLTTLKDKYDERWTPGKIAKFIKAFKIPFIHKGELEAYVGCTYRQRITMQNVLGLKVEHQPRGSKYHTQQIAFVYACLYLYGMSRSKAALLTGIPTRNTVIGMDRRVIKPRKEYWHDEWEDYAKRFDVGPRYLMRVGWPGPVRKDSMANSVDRVAERFARTRVNAHQSDSGGGQERPARKQGTHAVDEGSRGPRLLCHGDAQ